MRNYNKELKLIRLYDFYNKTWSKPAQEKLLQMIKETEDEEEEV